MTSEVIRYPHIDNLYALKPNPEIILGKRLIFTEKRDGSNLRFSLKDGKVQISSRNQDEASGDFQNGAKATEEYPKIVQLLSEDDSDPFHKSVRTNSKFIVFAEFLTVGTGPTRIEAPREKASLVVFDIYDVFEGTFLQYIQMYQMCYHYGLPVVEWWADSTHTTMESYREFADKVLDYAKLMGREGTVIKFVDLSPKADPRYIYWKEKLDIPPRPRLIKHDDGNAVLPLLPESEVRGEWNKMLADYGLEKLKDKAFAMPLFAQRIAQAAKENNCARPTGSLFTLYLLYVKESS
jgi:hypothetical protein